VQLRGRVIGVDWHLFNRSLRSEEQGLSAVERELFAQALRVSETLQTAHSMRLDLTALWQRSSCTKEQLVHQLEDWCQRAETSGMAALRDVSRHLRRYQLAYSVFASASTRTLTSDSPNLAMARLDNTQRPWRANPIARECLEETLQLD
jgi:hypothetical protein